MASPVDSATKLLAAQVAASLARLDARFRSFVAAYTAESDELRALLVQLTHA
jgi:hypothetical protein